MAGTQGETWDSEPKESVQYFSRAQILSEARHKGNLALRAHYLLIAPATLHVETRLENIELCILRHYFGGNSAEGSSEV